MFPCRQKYRFRYSSEHDINLPLKERLLAKEVFVYQIAGMKKLNIFNKMLK